MQSWSKGKSEIEIVDFLIVLNERLQFLDRHACLFGTMNESRRAKLQVHYDTLLQLLPIDLRASILRNAARSSAIRPSTADTDADTDDADPLEQTVLASQQAPDAQEQNASSDVAR